MVEEFDKTTEEQDNTSSPSTEQNDVSATEEVSVEQGDTSAEEVKEENETVQLKETIEQLEEKLLRLQAEIANMKRSHAREKQDILKYRSQALALAMVDAVDNLERALAVDVSSEDAQSLKKGVDMAYQQFLAAFEKENIERIDPINEPFDPNVHQAVSVMPGGEDQPSETVVNVLQKGYKLQDRVIRPAMVIVSE